MTQSFHQAVGNNSIRCLQFGSGARLMVCFHGFGDDAASFNVLEPSFGKHHTVVSVDLPFHGETIWNEEKFTPAQAQQLLQRLMQRYNVTQVSLAAYSIGGKIALKLFELNPEVVETMWLFAPDGLKNNIWYNLAVYPAWGRKLFRFLLNQPRLLISLVKGIQTFGIFSSGFAKFLQTQLQSPETRERVWNTWTAIAGFEMPPSRLKETMKRSATRCYIFMGQHDSVIKPRIGERFAHGISNARLIVLPKGHALLKPYLNEYIERILTP